MHSTIVVTSTAAEKLARNVIIFRARRKLSQEELAKATGVSRTTISNIERSETDPSVGVVEKVAIALGTTVSELFVDAPALAAADDDELSRLAAASRGSSVDARDLIVAIDEAAGHSPERYSNAGRPRSTNVGSTNVEG